MTKTPRKRRSNSNSTRRADAMFGYLIPVFFMALVGYQEVHDGHVDKWVVGSLMVFGLGALGWRIDAIFIKYFEARAGRYGESDGDEKTDDRK